MIKEKSRIYISDCGNFVAIQILGEIQPAYDVWRHDGSEYWEGNRYIEVPGKKGCYNPRDLYTDEFTHPKKIVGSWSRLMPQGFKLLLHDLETGVSLDVSFHTPIKTLAITFEKRRKTHRERIQEEARCQT